MTFAGYVLRYDGVVAICAMYIAGLPKTAGAQPFNAFFPLSITMQSANLSCDDGSSESIQQDSTMIHCRHYCATHAVRGDANT